MHGADAQLARYNRTANAHRRAVDQYLAAVGGLSAAEDLDQCRLAGPVFAHQRVNFTGFQVKLNIAQRLNARKTLGNCDQLQGWRGHGFALREGTTGGWARPWLWAAVHRAI